MGALVEAIIPRHRRSSSRFLNAKVACGRGCSDTFSPRSKTLPVDDLCRRLSRERGCAVPCAAAPITYHYTGAVTTGVEAIPAVPVGTPVTFTVTADPDNPLRRVPLAPYVTGCLATIDVNYRVQLPGDGRAGGEWRCAVPGAVPASDFVDSAPVQSQRARVSGFGPRFCGFRLRFDAMPSTWRRQSDIAALLLPSDIQLPPAASGSRRAAQHHRRPPSRAGAQFCLLMECGAVRRPISATAPVRVAPESCRTRRRFEPVVAGSPRGLPAGRVPRGRTASLPTRKRARQNMRRLRVFARALIRGAVSVARIVDCQSTSTGRDGSTGRPGRPSRLRAFFVSRYRLSPLAPFDADHRVSVSRSR